MQDTVIIGGGAAGLCTAIMLKLSTPKLSVTLLEACDRVVKKLAVTGNGRCNISNIKLTADRYHGDSELAKKLLKAFGYDAQKSFFASLGVPFCVLEEGKAYPKSLQATSVVDALRFKAEELGVDILLNCRVTEVQRIENGFSVLCGLKSVKCRTVVVATGGQAGGKLGSIDGYSVLKSMGHKIEKLYPAIVQIKTETDLVRQLKGIKVMANVTASSSLGARTEYGEVLFCDYGLSGPPVLQISRLTNGENAVVSLDIVPDMTESELEAELLNRVLMFKNRSASELLTGFLHKRLGQVILKSVGINLNAKCSEISGNAIKRLILAMKKINFKVTGNLGLENAQVTVGGAQTTQFFDNLMSKKARGLFAVGEVLNIDGDCGGFNLALCWAESFAAANGIKDYLK